MAGEVLAMRTLVTRQVQFGQVEVERQREREFLKRQEFLKRRELAGVGGEGKNEGRGEREILGKVMSMASYQE